MPNSGAFTIAFRFLMQTTSRAIVLHTLRYNDDHLIVHLFTEREGFVPMLVRISHAAKVAVRHTLFQPLALLEVSWHHRPTAGLQRPKAARTAVMFSDLIYNGHKLSVAFFLAEFLGAALRLEPPSEVLFSYLEQSIRWLDTADKGYSNFHLVFLLRLTQYLGFLPQIEAYRQGAFFDMLHCRFTPMRPSTPHLAPEEAQWLPTLLRINYDNMRHFRLTGEQRNRFLNIVNDYYRLHLTAFPQLKSLEVLRDIYQ